MSSRSPQLPALLNHLARHTNLHRVRHDQQGGDLEGWEQVRKQLENVEPLQAEPLIQQLQLWLDQQEQLDQSHHRSLNLLLEQIRSVATVGASAKQPATSHLPVRCTQTGQPPATSHQQKAGIQTSPQVQESVASTPPTPASTSKPKPSSAPAIPLEPQPEAQPTFTGAEIPASATPTPPTRKQHNLSRRQRFEEWLFRKMRRWAETASVRNRRVVIWLLAALLLAIRGRRRVMDANLRMAFPEKPRKERDRIARANYHWFARFAVDVLRLATWHGRTDEFVQIRNVEVLDAALAENRGTLIVTGHLGNWEFIPAVLAERGYPMTVYAGAQTNPLTDELHNETRRGFGIHLLGKGADAVMEIWHALKQRRIVGLLIDQDERKSGVFVDFFGTPASTRRGVAAFHRMFGSPVLLCVCPQVGEGVEVIFERIEFTASGNPEMDERELLQRATFAFEQQVRQYPEQYFWMHRRWRMRPDGASDPIY